MELILTRIQRVAADPYIGHGCLHRFSSAPRVPTIKAPRITFFLGGGFRMEAFRNVKGRQGLRSLSNREGPWHQVSFSAGKGGERRKRRQNNGTAEGRTRGA